MIILASKPCWYCYQDNKVSGNDFAAVENLRRKQNTGISLESSHSGGGILSLWETFLGIFTPGLNVEDVQNTRRTETPITPYQTETKRKV